MSEQLQKRCAIYTRKSVDAYVGEFGSLEAQRAICSAYVTSQLPKGWVEIEKRYDDLGETGANLNRPALQELLRDVESGMVDVIIIYKLDRITRTIVDFVRLMDLLDGYGVFFVSVTQNFDTGDSTGRLIQNILLTFAQFEREMMSDRLRDKFRTMKERGMFVGGHPPFGFDLIDKKLVPNTLEAKVVRSAFLLYLETKSLVKVARVLRDRGVRRRSRISKRGRRVEGRTICQSALWNMLANPLYVGNVRYKGQIHPGLHEAIISQDLWDNVQALRKRRTRARVVEKYKTDLLRGLIFDVYGRTVGVYRDFRYNPDGTRYYLSNQNEWGRRNGVRRYRTKADELEELILSSLSAQFVRRESFREYLVKAGYRGRQLAGLLHLGGNAARLMKTITQVQLQAAVKAVIERIDVSEDQILVSIRAKQFTEFAHWNGVGLLSVRTSAPNANEPIEVLTISTSTVRIKRDLTNLFTQRRVPDSASKNPALIRLVRQARRAQGVIDDSHGLSVLEVSKACHCAHTRLPRLLRLNYLAPDIIASILDGRQPSVLTAKELMSKDLPLDWSAQRRLLGFSEQQDTLQSAPGW